MTVLGRWHADPADGSRLRWHTGESWTGHTVPAPPPPVERDHHADWSHVALRDDNSDVDVPSEPTFDDASQMVTQIFSPARSSANNPAAVGVVLAVLAGVAASLLGLAGALLVVPSLLCCAVGSRRASNLHRAGLRPAGRWLSRVGFAVSMVTAVASAALWVGII